MATISVISGDIIGLYDFLVSILLEERRQSVDLLLKSVDIIVLLLKFKRSQDCLITIVPASSSSPPYYYSEILLRVENFNHCDSLLKESGATRFDLRKDELLDDRRRIAHYRHERFRIDIILVDVGSGIGDDLASLAPYLASCKLQVLSESVPIARRSERKYERSEVEKLALAWSLSQGKIDPASGALEKIGSRKSRSRRVVTAESSDWHPSVGKRIRTIYPSLLHLKEFRPVTANSPEPIPYSTELFSGRMLLMVQTRPMDELYRARLEGTKYTFEVFSRPSTPCSDDRWFCAQVQVQGKFNRLPVGSLYFGAEVTKRMELGLFTRGLCISMIQLAKAVNPFIHYSFGDKLGAELPHLVTPIWSTVDRLVVTPEGAAPPPFGRVFAETVESRSKRRANAAYSPPIDLNSTYSFSFKTSNIDLIDWKLLNIPLIKPMDLHTFWSDADLRLIAYELLPPGKSHALRDVNHMFSLEIRHQVCYGIPYFQSVDSPTQSNHPGAPFYNDNDADPSYAGETSTAPVEAEDRADEASSVAEDEEEDLFLDEASAASESDDELLSADEDEFFDCVDEHARPHSRPPSNSRPNPPAPLSFRPSSAPALSFYDNEYVMAIFEIDDYRRQGGRRTCYAFLADPWSSSLDMAAPKSCILRTYKEWTAALPTSKPDPRPFNFLRLSESEQRRQELNHSFKELYKKILPKTPKYALKLRSFLSPAVHTQAFLSKEGTSWVSSVRLRHGLADFLMESVVSVQLSNVFWSEECMGLTRSELVFIKPSNRLTGKKSHLVIPLKSLLAVRRVRSNEYFFTIQGLSFPVFASFRTAIDQN